MIWRKITIIRKLLTVILLWLLLCLPKAYALESVDCSDESKLGTCPSDLINHRCQIEKGSGSSQVILLGRCENVEENVSGKNETHCKCVEDPPPSYDYHIETAPALNSGEDLYTVEDESIEENNSDKDEIKESGNKLIEKIKDKLRGK